MTGRQSSGAKGRPVSKARSEEKLVAVHTGRRPTTRPSRAEILASPRSDPCRHSRDDFDGTQPATRQASRSQVPRMNSIELVLTVPASR